MQLLNFNSQQDVQRIVSTRLIGLRNIPIFLQYYQQAVLSQSNNIFTMNHHCKICRTLAMIVCVHPQCNQYPFLCGKYCKDGSDKLFQDHTHDGCQQLVDYHTFQSQLFHNEQNSFKALKNQNNSYIAQMEEKLKTIKVDIDLLLQQLKQGINRNDICLTPEIQQIRKKLLSTDDYKLTGRQISIYLNTQVLYQSETYNIGLQTQIKKKFQLRVSRLQNIDLKQSLVRDYDRAFYYYNKGIEYQNAEDWNKALNSFKLSKVLDEQSVDSIFMIGNCYEFLGIIDKAITYYSKFIEKANDQNQLLEESYYNLGVIYHRKGEHEKALSCYNQAIKRGTGIYLHYFKKRAELCFKMENYEQSVKDYTTLIRLSPQSQYVVQRSKALKRLNQIARIGNPQEKQFGE